jgi:RNA-binding protein NOB1
LSGADTVLYCRFQTALYYNNNSIPYSYVSMNTTGSPTTPTSTPTPTPTTSESESVHSSVSVGVGVGVGVSVSVGISTEIRNENENKTKTEENSRYRCLVVDSGPIIKHAGIRNLFGKAELYITVPGVMDEIRDGKARAHLEQWPMELQVKSPTPESIHRIIAFSKQTGDYAALSKVDLEVLALVLDLEREGCGNLEHVRTSPKRMIGLGNMRSLKNEKEEEKKMDTLTASESPEPNQSSGSCTEEGNNNNHDGNDKDKTQLAETKGSKLIETKQPPTQTVQGPKSWATLVNPSVVSNHPPHVDMASPRIQDGGQFSDAEETEDDEEEALDEQHDVQETDLESEFPSLSAAATVPYEGSEDEDEDENVEKERKLSDDKLLLIEKKMQALQPISKSGKLYNSFRKYGKLMKPKAVTSEAAPKEENTVDNASKDPWQARPEDIEEKTNQQSRIIGGGGMMSSEDMGWDEDDGEGWITCKSDILSAAGNGSLGGPQKKNGESARGPVGPPQSHRTACTTTDFAMQNVLLQMSLALLSVDGVQIRRVKSWVHRCGACFKIHTDAEFQGMKRIFCSHCGSDMMQRIAASVDGKTGRLKLHLSKKYKHNLRGTKFSLPKPGSVSDYV